MSSLMPLSHGQNGRVHCTFNDYKDVLSFFHSKFVKKFATIVCEHLCYNSLNFTAGNLGALPVM